MRQTMVDMVHRLQDTICDAIGGLDESTYRDCLLYTSDAADD